MGENRGWWVQGGFRVLVALSASDPEINECDIGRDFT